MGNEISRKGHQQHKKRSHIYQHQREGWNYTNLELHKKQNEMVLLPSKNAAGQHYL
uniref:Uncharacterized protein n=1 Tax=Arion vulgaris TaxID=1028688 RepID=A0A0B7B6C1_9EUPU